MPRPPPHPTQSPRHSPRPPVRRDLEGLRHGLGVVRVGVQHGGADDVRYVGGVGGGAAVAGEGGEADLGGWRVYTVGG
jgi:hypothetical protein